MRIISLSAHWCLPFIAILVLFWSAAPLRAEADLVGIVVDYQPRARVAGKAVCFIKRTDESDMHPVREHEMIYEGDRIIFDAAAGPNAFVKALVASREAVTIDPAHPEFPKQSRSFLASWVPKLLAAYRWINPASEEVDEPRNALSRAE